MTASSCVALLMWSPWSTWPISVTRRRRLLPRLLLRVVPNGSSVIGQPSAVAGLRPLPGESSKRIDNVSVVDNLQRNLPFWRHVLQANKFILDSIEHGYTIPFISDSPSTQAVNNKSALDHPVFVRDAIYQLH